MKRSGFARKPLPASRARVRQWEGDTMPTARAPLRMATQSAQLCIPLPKAGPLQHAGYMDLVRSMRCYRCKAPPRSQFCHRDEGKGQGIKTDCREGWPGCAMCHFAIGTARVLSKAKRRAYELEAGRATRAEILASGKWPARLPRWIE